MGCTNGKSSDACKEINIKLNNLLNSYSSIEFYIQTQRALAYDSLLKDIDNNEREEVALLDSEVNDMDNIHKDLAIFRRFKVINKYKYEIIVTKFLKNIKSCIFKIQNINEINSKYLEELNDFRNTINGNKISKKFEEKVQRLHSQIYKVSSYLEMDQNAPTNVSYNAIMELNSTFINKRISAHQFPLKQSPTSQNEIEQFN